jgi:hypothetical protein
VQVVGRGGSVLARRAYRRLTAAGARRLGGAARRRRLLRRAVRPRCPRRAHRLSDRRQADRTAVATAGRPRRRRPARRDRHGQQSKSMGVTRPAVLRRPTCIPTSVPYCWGELASARPVSHPAMACFPRFWPACGQCPSQPDLRLMSPDSQSLIHGPPAPVVTKSRKSRSRSQL